VCIGFCDGLKGLSQAINTVWETSCSIVKVLLDSICRLPISVPTQLVVRLSAQLVLLKMFSASSGAQHHRASREGTR
jgi:hypothetical protein